MFEKVYLCLLRLFPVSFRKRYQDEAMQLFRDRLRDERGLMHRLRLLLDLTADLVRSLPQAHRNSYPEATPVPSVGETLSFRSLEKEPMRREAIAIAWFLSLGALLLFPYVLKLSSNDHVRLQSHPSAIASVMERLNPTAPTETAVTRGDPAGEPGTASESVPAVPSMPVSAERQRPTSPTHTAGPDPAPNGIPESAASSDGSKQPVALNTPGAVDVYTGRPSGQAVLVNSAQAHAGQLVAPEWLQIAPSVQSSSTSAGLPRSVLSQRPKAGSPLLTVDILSDTQGVDFGPYLEHVVATVQKGWRSSLPAGKLARSNETVIRCNIGQNGTVGGMVLLKGSHEQSLDQAAWRSITSAGPFPPLPAAFNGPSLTMNLHFTVDPQP